MKYTRPIYTYEYLSCNFFSVFIFCNDSRSLSFNQPEEQRSSISTDRSFRQTICGSHASAGLLPCSTERVPESPLHVCKKHRSATGLLCGSIWLMSDDRLLNRRLPWSCCPLHRTLLPSLQQERISIIRTQTSDISWPAYRPCPEPQFCLVFAGGSVYRYGRPAAKRTQTG